MEWVAVALMGISSRTDVTSPAMKLTVLGTRMDFPAAHSFEIEQVAAMLPVQPYPAAAIDTHLWLASFSI